MTEQRDPWERYLDDILSFEAGCVTLCTSTDVPLVLGAFGSQAGHPSPEPPAGAMPTMEITVLPAGVLVCEDLATEGARNIVLNEVSREGKAACVYWDVNGNCEIVFSSYGTNCGRYLFNTPHSSEGLPPSLQVFAPELDRAEDRPRAAMAPAQAFTQIGLSTPPTLATVRHLIEHPKTELRYSKEGLETALARINADILTLAVEADPQTLHSVAQWATIRILRRARLENVPPVREAVERLQRSLPASFGTDLEGLARPLESELWYRPSLAPLSEADQKHRKETASKVWALQALRHACQPDPETSALGAIYTGSIVLNAKELEDYFVEACQRLGKSAP